MSMEPRIETIRSSKVRSTKRHSAGEADSITAAIGRPFPSEMAMIFVPFPRFVFPTHVPLFRRTEASVDEEFGPIDGAGEDKAPAESTKDF